MFGSMGKGSGMEMMVGSILQSLGVNKDVIMNSVNQFQALVSQIKNAMEETSERTKRIEEKIDLLLQNPVLNIPVKFTGDNMDRVVNAVNRACGIAPEICSSYKEMLEKGGQYNLPSVAHEDELEETELVKHGK